MKKYKFKSYFVFIHIVYKLSLIKYLVITKKLTDIILIQKIFQNIGYYYLPLKN